MAYFLDHLIILMLDLAIAYSPLLLARFQVS